jgi:hypothetical protein
MRGRVSSWHHCADAWVRTKTKWASRSDKGVVNDSHCHDIVLSNDRQKEPVTSASPPAPDLRAFLGIGFRPLSLAGMAWAPTAIAIRI